MKLLSLAVAGIVDANSNQDHTRQFVEYSPAQVSSHIERGRKIRSQSVVGLFDQLMSAVSAFVESARTRAEERKTRKALSVMSEHLLRDIGLTNNDIENLNTGLVSLDDLSVRRIEKQLAQQTLSGAETTSIKTFILDIDCANDESFELAKCG
jgi:uncharacterized protein YjiS (DUF1127 family)